MLLTRLFYYGTNMFIYTKTIGKKYFETDLKCIE